MFSFDFMALEENVEKELIPLVFSGMNFDGSCEYKRLDTGEIINGENVDVLCKDLEINEIAYVSILGLSKVKGLKKIKIECPLKEANGLVLFDEYCTFKETLSYYSANYCKINEKALKKKETESSLGKGFSI